VGFEVGQRVPSLPAMEPWEHWKLRSGVCMGWSPSCQEFWWFLNIIVNLVSHHALDPGTLVHVKCQKHL